jgi:serine phosphatase RsbU (regulator of sigma subunit)
MEETTLPEVELELDTGDCVLLYTDGALDAGAPARTLDPDGLAARLSESAPQSAEAAVRDVVDIAAGLADGPLRDDLAVLALRLV